MINRDEYIDDYGLQVDPLFDLVDQLQKEAEEADKEIEETQAASDVWKELAMEKSKEIEDKKKVIAESIGKDEIRQLLHYAEHVDGGTPQSYYFLRTRLEKLLINKDQS